MQLTEREQKDAVERMWFRRIVTLLMVGMISVGAIPVIKNTLYPVQRNR